jgi:hypothetical protein
MPAPVLLISAAVEAPAITTATAAAVAVQLAASVEVGSVLIATVAGRLLLQEASSWPVTEQTRCGDRPLPKPDDPDPVAAREAWVGTRGAAELNISRPAAATADGAHPGRSFANRDAALASQLRWLGQSAGAKPTKNLYRPSRLRRRSALGSPRGRARLRAAGDDKCVGG